MDVAARSVTQSKHERPHHPRHEGHVGVQLRLGALDGAAEGLPVRHDLDGREHVLERAEVVRERAAPGHVLGGELLEPVPERLRELRAEALQGEYEGVPRAQGAVLRDAYWRVAL